MTRPDLDAIGTRAEAALEGPWTWEAYSETLGNINGDGFPVASMVDGDDAAFIAAAREDVPALLAYVRELEGSLAALQATLGGGPGVPLDGEALAAWMLGGG